MNPLDDFDTWLAIARTIAMDVTQFGSLYDSFETLINSIISTDFLPTTTAAKTKEFLNTISTSFCDSVLMYGQLSPQYIDNPIKYLKLFLKLSIYGIQIGDEELISIGTKILNKKDTTIYLKNEDSNIFERLTNYFVQNLQATNVITDVIKYRVDNLVSFNNVLPMLINIVKFDINFQFIDAIKISAPTISKIFQHYIARSQINYLPNIIQQFLTILPMEETGYQEFLNLFLPISLDFILSNKINLSYNGFLSLSKILDYSLPTMPQYQMAVCSFITQSSQFQKITEIPFTKQLSPFMESLYSKLAKNELLQLDTAIRLWDNHEKIHMNEKNAFFKMQIEIIANSSGELLAGLIDFIIEKKNSIQNWIDFISNLINRLDLITIFNPVPFTQFRNYLFQQSITNPALRKPFNKLLKLTGDSTFLDSVIDYMNANTFDKEFIYSTLCTLIIQCKDIIIDPAKVNLLLSNSLAIAFQDDSPCQILDFIPALCQKQNVKISSEQISTIVSHRFESRYFFNFLDNIFKNNILDEETTEKLIEELSENLDIEFFNFFSKICKSANNYPNYYVDLDIKYEKYLWKFALTKGKAMNLFSNLLCTLVAQNDDKFVSDDTMYRTFFDTVEDHMHEDGNIEELIELVCTFIDTIENVQDSMYLLRNADLNYHNPEKNFEFLTVHVSYDNQLEEMKMPQLATAGSVVTHFCRIKRMNPNFLVLKCNNFELLPTTKIADFIANGQTKIRLDIVSKAVPQNQYRLRQRLPCEFIKERNWYSAFHNNMINNSKAAYKFMNSTCITLELCEPISRIMNEKTLESVKNAFNVSTPYVCSYNLGTVFYYLFTQNAKTLIESLVQAEFFTYIFGIINKIDKSLQVYDDIILLIIKIISKCNIKFSEDNADVIFRGLMDIAASSSQAFVHSKIFTTIQEVFKDIKIPFPEQFIDTFKKLLIKSPQFIRKDCVEAFKKVEIPVDVYINVLKEFDENVSDEFLQLMLDTRMDYTNQGKNVVMIVMNCIDKSHDNHLKMFLDLLNNILCHPEAGISDSTCGFIQDYLVNRFIRFDISRSDMRVFRSAAVCLMRVDSAVDENNNNKLFDILQFFHEHRKPLDVYNVDGEKFMLNIERPGIRKYYQTCYLNATIQLLFSVIPLRNLVLSAKSSQKMLANLHELFMRMHLTKCNSVSAKTFADSCSMFEGDVFSPHEQQDAMEFMGQLLDKIQEDETYKNSFKEICQGKIEHHLEGIDYEYNNTDTETFSCISVETAPTLEESLEIFVSPTFLVNDDKYQVSGKQERIDAKRSSVFEEAPTVLFVNIKRFSYNMNLRKREKVSTNCIIPPILDLTKFMKNKETKVYKLIGAVVHKGTALRGHYVTYSRSINGDFWILLDDGLESKVSEEETFKAINGDNDEATGYIFAYLLVDNTDKPISEEELHKFEFSQDLIEEIDSENEKIVQASFFCSTGYHDMMYYLSSKKKSQYSSIIMRYLCDSIPYISKDCSTGKIYQNIYEKMKTDKNLSREFFEYCQPFLRDMLVMSANSFVRSESTTLILASIKSGAVSYEEYIPLLLNLIDGLFEKYDTSNDVFRAIYLILKQYNADDILKQPENSQRIMDFFTVQFNNFCQNHPELKRSYILCGIDMTYYMKILSRLHFSPDEMPVLYNDATFVQFMTTKSKAGAISKFVITYFAPDSYIEFFKRSSHGDNLSTITQVLFEICPDEAISLLYSGGFNQEEVVNSIIACGKKKKRFADILLAQTQMWCKLYLLHIDLDIRNAAKVIPSAICQSADLISLAEEEEDDRQFVLTEEEIEDRCTELVKKLLDCVGDAANALVSEKRNSNETVFEYISVIESAVKTSKEEVVDDLEKLTVLFEPIGTYSTKFSEQGSELLSLFSTFKVEVKSDVVNTLFSDSEVENTNDVKHFDRYLASMIYVMERKDLCFDLLSFFMDNAVFCIPSLAPTNINAINRILGYIVKRKSEMLITYLDENFAQILENRVNHLVIILKALGIKRPIIQQYVSDIIDEKLTIGAQDLENTIAVDSTKEIDPDVLEVLNFNIQSQPDSEQLKFRLYSYLESIPTKKTKQESEEQEPDTNVF